MDDSKEIIKRLHLGNITNLQTMLETILDNYESFLDYEEGGIDKVVSNLSKERIEYLKKDLQILGYKPYRYITPISSVRIPPTSSKSYFTRPKSVGGLNKFQWVQ